MNRWMRVDDAAFEVPPNDRQHFATWHWFWEKIFGRRMPTSGERAHIGNLVLSYRPDLVEIFGTEKWGTDARRVHRIGDLFVFDYGDTPIETVENPFKMAPREIDTDGLLADNMQKYKTPERAG